MPEAPRQHLRCAGRIPVDLRVESWADFARLYTKDISYGGLFVETDDPPDVFSSVEVRLHLPDGAGTIPLTARVVHAVPADCKPAGATAGMGLEFSELTDEQKRLLAGWLARGQGASPAPEGDVGQGSVPSLSESELPVVLPESVHGMLSAKLASMPTESFEVLDVPRTIDAKALRQRYLALAKKYHPQRWAHYEDAEITDLARRIGDHLERAYERVKASIEGPKPRPPAAPTPAARVEGRTGPHRVPVNARFRQTHAELSDFAADVQRVKPAPDGAPVSVQIGEALKHLALKHYDVARAALQRVIEQDPANTPAKIWLRVAAARQHKQLGDGAGAVALYREILEQLDPAHGEALKEVRAAGGRLSSLFRKIKGK